MALSRGFGQVDKDAQDLKDRREKSQVFRVWIKANSSITAVFLDDEPVRFEEYRSPFNKGTRPEFAIKPDAGQKDRFLAAGYESAPRYAFTIIDCSKRKDKQGKDHQNEKKLLVVSSDIAKLLNEKRVAWGGLKGKAVIIRRMGDKSSSSGSDFELMMKDGKAVTVKMSVFKDVEPFNYEKVFAAHSDDDAIRTLARWGRSGDNNSAVPLEDDGPTTEDIPVGDAPAGEMAAGDDDLPF